MSKNVSSDPDNPQERFLREIPENLGWLLVGFTEGEGSFNLSVVKRSDYVHIWQLNLSFNISQRDKTLLQLAQDILKCGAIRFRKDGVYAFEVRSVNDITQKVIPFFNHFELISKEKKEAFRIFSEIAKIMERKEHLTLNGLKKILKLRRLMNLKSGRKRKYSDQFILNLLRKSSETTRRAH